MCGLSYLCLCPFPWHPSSCPSSFPSALLAWTHPCPQIPCPSSMMTRTDRRCLCPWSHLSTPTTMMNPLSSLRKALASRTLSKSWLNLPSTSLRNPLSKSFQNFLSKSSQSLLLSKSFRSLLLSKSFRSLLSKYFAASPSLLAMSTVAERLSGNRCPIDLLTSSYGFTPQNTGSEAPGSFAGARVVLLQVRLPHRHGCERALNF